MPRKKTREEFIKEAKEIHGDKYDYSLVEYVNSKTKVEIKCNRCEKSFLQIPNSHLQGIGCPHCGLSKGALARKMTQKEFIEKAKQIHGSMYDFSKVIYVNSLTKVKVICNSCGHIWNVAPNKILQGRGCPKCAIVNVHNKQRWTQDYFIKQVKKIYGNLYDLSKVKYINSLTKVILICRIHGEFKVTPNSLIHNKQKCPLCVSNKKKTTEQFIIEAYKIHKDAYCYDKVNYENAHKKVEIICKKHNISFFQTPHSHINHSQGCPICKSSHGERAIFNYLQKYNIEFSRQYKVVIDNSKHYFDFYLPNYNMLIEFQGRQHYEVGYFGGKQGLINRQERDQIKRDYALSQGIELLEIPYWELKRVDEILEERIIMKYGV